MAHNIETKFSSYPDHIRPIMQELRSLILSVSENNELGVIEETLKWGEPAYLTKHGSTVRIDWKAKHPNNLFIYFNCKTTLIETFKEIYFDVFKFEGSRAIVLNIDESIPKYELRDCIIMSLRYHEIKHLSLLGYR